MVMRVTGIIFFTTAVVGIVFQGTTFALPKVFEEQLESLVGCGVATAPDYCLDLGLGLGLG